MTAQIKLRTEDIAPLRAHYQNVAFDVLGLLWAYKWMIAAFAIAGVITAAAAIVLLPPRFTAEAILQVNFSREEPNSPVRMQRIASLEAGAIVESTLRVLRSRTLASAVVSRLNLEDEPDFNRPSRLRRILREVRERLGLSVAVPSTHDVATERLMSALRINIVPRSYVITIAMDASDPERAARVVNAVVLEHIRGQQVQQLSELRKGIEREIADLSAIYGTRHPRSISATEKLRELQSRIAAINETNSIDAEVIELFGEFHPAEAVMIPSGPNTMILTTLIVAGFLLVCGAIIVIREIVKSRAAAFSQPKFVLEVPDDDNSVFPKMP